MKFMIATAALLFALGTTAPAYAQHDDKGDGSHSQGEHSQAGHSQAGHSQAAPAQQQHSQQSGHNGGQQTNAANRSRQGNGGGGQGRVQQSRSTGGNGGFGRNGGNRGNYAHGRISDDHYASHFGSGHSFRVNRGDYDRRRFDYGGYSFGFIDPWPVGWGYSDDVYVVYDGGGYFMYDRYHPGFRISLNIL